MLAVWGVSPMMAVMRVNEYAKATDFFDKHRQNLIGK